MVRHPLLVYFALAYGISWLLWLPAILGHLQGHLHFEDAAIFLFLGSFGPLLSALATAALSGGRAGVRAWAKGLLRWRVSVVWYLVALYGFPALGMLTVALLRVASLSDVLSRLPHGVLFIPVNALTTFLITGPLGEEPGWRGFALPRLQVDRGALSASTILGLLWAFWHSPLMLIPEWRNDVPLGAFLILYSLYFIALAIVFTWVYNGASRSALITTVLHGSFNYTIFFLNDRYGFTRYGSATVQAVSVAVLWAVAALLIGFTGTSLGAEGATRRKG